MVLLSFVLPTFLADKFGFCLFCPPGNAALGQVIDRNLNGHAVARQNLNVVHTQFAGNVRGHDVTVRQFDFEASVGERLHHRAFKLDDVILLCQNNPSLWQFLIFVSRVRKTLKQAFQKSRSTCVRINTPRLVRATVFS